MNMKSSILDDNHSDLLTSVIEAVAEIAGVEISAIDADASLIELGIDSLALVDLVFRLEKTFGVRLGADARVLDDAASARTYAAHVKSRLAIR